MQLLQFSFVKAQKDLFLAIAVVKKENEILKRSIILHKKKDKIAETRQGLFDRCFKALATGSPCSFNSPARNTARTVSSTE